MLYGYIEILKFDIEIKKILISLKIKGLDRFSPNFVWNISRYARRVLDYQLTPVTQKWARGSRVCGRIAAGGGGGEVIEAPRMF